MSHELSIPPLPFSTPGRAFYPKRSITSDLYWTPTGKARLKTQPTLRTRNTLGSKPQRGGKGSCNNKEKRQRERPRRTRERGHSQQPPGARGSFPRDELGADWEEHLVFPTQQVEQGPRQQRQAQNHLQQLHGDRSVGSRGVRG